MRLQGVSGQVRYSYHVAAEISSWTVDVCGPGEYALSMRIDVVSPFWMARRPLDVVLVLGSKTMTWEGADIPSEGPDVSASLHGLPKFGA